MTTVPLETKVALTSGADFWNTRAVPEADLPAVMVTDGPHGVRKQAGAADHIGLNDSIPSTCFPPAVAQAATWNRALVEEVGVALGQEARALGVGVLLGPGVNLKRSPLCGRNFEYYSEDPFITGALGTAFVNGVQSEGVGTSLKHFAANNQETDRMRRDSQIDERTLRELYLRAFGTIVRDAKPWTVMCSYNMVNGVFAAENRFLLTELLRAEWGFEGFVVSDWASVKNPVASLQAGLDLAMPADPDHARAVLTAIEEARLDSSVVDTAFERVSRVLRRAVATLEGERPALAVDQHHALARRVAEQSIVLLENDGILPLSADANVALIGEFARTPRYQGAGSSRVNPTRLDSALDAIQSLLGRTVPFAPGFTTEPARPAPADAHQTAVSTARDADNVIVFLGLGENHESEGYDRETLDLPVEQLALLDDILAVNPNVVVVLSNGATVLVPFAAQVRAVVESWLLGQAGGLAIADMLFGVVAPSGKLTETIPLRLEDVPSHPFFPGDKTGVRYGEGLFVGYRGYDQRDDAVAYPFGHGLSYTSFAYSDLSVTAAGDDLDVAVTVSNVGPRAGREVVQVYVAVDGSQGARPPRELKGFTDVFLDPGASQRATVRIAADDLAYWDVTSGQWEIEPGEYTVSVGGSSRDLPVSSAVTLRGTFAAQPLTIDATFAEAVAFPGFLEALAEGSLDGMPTEPDDARMMASIPLWSLAILFGAGRADMEALLAKVNAAAGAQR